MSLVPTVAAACASGSISYRPSGWRRADDGNWTMQRALGAGSSEAADMRLSSVWAHGDGTLQASLTIHNMTRSVLTMKGIVLESGSDRFPGQIAPPDATFAPDQWKETTIHFRLSGPPRRVLKDPVAIILAIRTSRDDAADLRIALERE